MAAAFSLLWAFALGTRLWLASRQLKRLEERADSIPPVFREAITIEDNRKAAAYSSDKTRLARLGTVVDAAMVLGFTFGGGLDLLAHWTSDLGLSALASGVLLLVLVAAVHALVDLPFSWYRQFTIEARHGFNRMTPRLFVVDLLKGTLVSAILGIPLAAAALHLMAVAGDTWWLWLWLLWSAFNLALLWLFPVFVAPLFNRFKPLEDPGLTQRIGNLLARCGFHAAGLFVMDGSRRSSHGNAYFTGFGRNRRIVFFDTLLERLSPDQIEAVLAHELGHFHHRHVLKRLVVAIVGAGISLAALAWLRQTPWFFDGLGIHQISDATALVAFSIVLPLLLFPFQPVLNGMSRRDEFEADEYAVKQASGAHLQTALIALYRDNSATLDPDPLHSLFYDSHPSAMARIGRLRPAAQ